MKTPILEFGAFKFDLGQVPSNMPNVKSLGAKGDGVTDDTQAFLDANEIGGFCIVPPGDYLLTQMLSPKNGTVFVGAGWGTSNSSKARTRLYFAVPGGQPAITVAQGNSTGQTVGFARMVIQAADWVRHTGPGIVCHSRIVMEDVYVGNFPKSNIILTHDATSNGPYGSRLVNVTSCYSGQHGIVVGTGANVVTLINCDAKWNGSPAYGVAPAAAGNYDGVYVSPNGDGNPDGVVVYSPQALTIIGGDASYNSRYGWNIDIARQSFITPGYAEGNFKAAPGQARVGNIQNCFVHFCTLANGKADLHFDLQFAAYQFTNNVWVGGQLYGGGAAGLASSVLLAAKAQYLAYDPVGGGNIYLEPELDGGGAPTGNLFIRSLGGTDAVIKFARGGTDKLRIGNTIEIPGGYMFQGTWVSKDAGAPTTGTWRQGDIYWNNNPLAGGYIGWVCVAAGTPGTWKGFGAIQA